MKKEEKTHSRGSPSHHQKKRENKSKDNEPAEKPRTSKKLPTSTPTSSHQPPKYLVINNKVQPQSQLDTLPNRNNDNTKQRKPPPIILYENEQKTQTISILEEKKLLHKKNKQQQKNTTNRNTWKAKQKKHRKHKIHNKKINSRKQIAPHIHSTNNTKQQHKQQSETNKKKMQEMPKNRTYSHQLQPRVPLRKMQRPAQTRGMPSQ
ncbi:hypothetical protein WN51_03998 [Melipona quadrifasciata]|uniref:Uncharacterized protein n=1 Tax=Melipona quadrifasciata TaxID=166423 RepID=A0A0N0BC72_9HYME|nr:hypothetical protein WN51_03998 [Melipona quadrifasciata]